ncbi:MAG: OmpA family protein [Campylobacterota bacterium]|nr:OmpA family protein [Campylobacterota bacterium]
MKTNILIAALLLGTSLSASYVDHIGARVGISKAIMSEHDTSKVDTKEVESLGPLYDLSAVFNVSDEGFFSEYKPYLDYSGRYYDSRVINVATLGLYHGFGSWKGFEPYAAAGLGYSFLNWRAVPLGNTSSKDHGSSSISGSLEGGLNYKLTDAFDLTFGARFDVYRMETKFKTEDHTTTQSDDYALSALVGIRFYFDRGAKKVADKIEATPKATPAVVAPVVAAAVSPEVESETTAVGAVAVAPCDLSSIKRSVYFDYASPDIAQRSEADMKVVADCLKDHPDTKVEFEGHTDSIGSKAFNQKLSEKRAVSAKAFVAAKGINTSRIATSGRGELDPVASNKTEDGRAQNRRVDILFVDGKVPVLFDYNSADLKGEVSKLANILTFMQKNPTSSITVVGHTDKIGSKKFNIKLSKRRAAAVRNFLVGNGIDKSRIKMIAKGKAEPVADNETDGGRAKNRRAEMNLRH